MSSFYWHKTPHIVAGLFPKYLWHKSRDEKNIYLTFDDGPVPGVTEFVLSELEEFGAKATFFSVGQNIEKHSDIFHKIIERGHSIGNHTFNHINGRKVPVDHFLQNVEKCQTAINREGYHRIHKLFRPPFGMIRRSAAGRIKNNYTIVMWDVLSGDFDMLLSPEKSLTKSIRSIQNGSIVVFHDSLKSEKTLKFVLPRFLSHLAENQYTCKPL